jgi:hypothetical protein
MDQSEVVEGLRDAYGDLLDMDASSLSDEFLTSKQNLEDMKLAIDGDTEAYNRLMMAAQSDIVTHLNLSQ